MATYKQPCIHCGEMIKRDSRFCAKCGSRSPFGFQCPACFKPIQRGDKLCGGCGKPLVTVCPVCGGQTFAGSDKCDACGRSLMIRCDNTRCGELQYFEIRKCTICGKTIKSAGKQIDAMK